LFIRDKIYRQQWGALLSGAEKLAVVFKFCLFYGLSLKFFYAKGGGVRLHKHIKDWWTLLCRKIRREHSEENFVLWFTLQIFLSRYKKRDRGL